MNTAAGTLPRLNRATLAALRDADPEAHPARLQTLPERVLQFGEGVFLRGFVDEFIDRLNRAGLFNGRVVVVQPRPGDKAKRLNEQDGLYALLLRGIEGGQIVDRRQLVESISRGIDPYADFAAFLECAGNPHLRFIVSNTTEAGIAITADERATDEPPASFPGKLAVFLLARFRAFGGAADKGMVILPCELIEQNGTALKSCVLQLAKRWQLPADFMEWVAAANVFANTLVDRIVSGFPTAEAPAIFDALGYEDRLLNVAEPYHAWIIEAPATLSKELPFHKVGLNVVWTDDVAPHRELKVRILNGGHTMMALAALLSGKGTVRAAIDDDTIGAFLKRGIDEEVIPTLAAPPDQARRFADSVLERFSNPFLEHRLLNIAVNSTSKFRTRLVPSLLRYCEQNSGRVPRRLAFSLAALIAFYRGGRPNPIVDEPAAVTFFAEVWETGAATQADVAALVRIVLSRQPLWGTDLNAVSGLPDAVAGSLHAIATHGVPAAMKSLESVEETPQ